MVLSSVYSITFLLSNVNNNIYESCSDCGAPES